MISFAQRPVFRESAVPRQSRNFLTSCGKSLRNVRTMRSPGLGAHPDGGQVRRQVIATLAFLRNCRRAAGLSSRGVRLRTSGAAPYPKIRKCSATPSARRRFSLPISHLGNGGVEDGSSGSSGQLILRLSRAPVADSVDSDFCPIRPEFRRGDLSMQDTTALS